MGFEDVREDEDNLDYWRLCDELSVRQAALLVVGVNPSGETGANCDGWQVHERPHGYGAAVTAISNALRRRAIDGYLIPVYDYDINGRACLEVEDSVDISASRVNVESLKE